MRKALQAPFFMFVAPPFTFLVHRLNLPHQLKLKSMKTYTLIFKWEGKDDQSFTVKANDEKEALKKLNTIDFYAEVDGDLACAIEEGTESLPKSIDKYCKENSIYNCRYELHSKSGSSRSATHCPDCGKQTWFLLDCPCGSSKGTRI